MKFCNRCQENKEDSEFSIRNDTGGLRAHCKRCNSKTVIKSQSTAKWRKNTKNRLIEEHGSKCVDCGHSGPPYHFDFDHRDPIEKKFAISRYGHSFEEIQREASKCDLVCAICHRDRTHKQRCNGCDECLDKCA